MTVWPHEIERLGQAAGPVLQNGVTPVEGHEHGHSPRRTSNEPPGVAVYARVSSGDQKTDLDRQLSCLAEFSAKHGFRVVEAVQETGSD